VLRKDDDDWVQKWSMKYRVPDYEEDQRGHGSLQVMKKDCHARKLNKDDAVDLSRWRKLTKDVR